MGKAGAIEEEMRIGLITPDHAAEIGGGHTYTDMILKAAVGFDFGHDVVVLNYNSIAQDFSYQQNERARIAGEIRDHNARVTQEAQKARDAYRNRSLGKKLSDAIKSIFSHRDNVAELALNLLLPDPENVDDQNLCDFIKVRIDEAGIELLWLMSPMPIFDPVVPYAITVWDLAHRRFPFFPEVSTQGWNWEAREEFYKRLLPKASYIFVGNDIGAREIRENYAVSLDKIRIIPLPTPTFNDAKCDRSLPENKYIFYPAQFWPHKNHIRAVKALSLIRRELGLDIDLVLTGSDQGNMKYVQQVVVEQDLVDHVLFLGFVDRSYLRMLYQNAEALLYISFFGPDNLPPLEACSVGCPVLLSDHPGHREQIGNAALFVDHRSEYAIAEGVQRICTDSSLKSRLVDEGFKLATFRSVSSYLVAIKNVIDEFNVYRQCWPSSQAKQITERSACDE